MEFFFEREEEEDEVGRGGAAREKVRRAEREREGERGRESCPLLCKTCTTKVPLMRGEKKK